MIMIKANAAEISRAGAWSDRDWVVETRANAPADYPHVNARQ
jgi:hypothetical protein